MTINSVEHATKVGLVTVIYVEGVITKPAFAYYVQFILHLLQQGKYKIILDFSTTTSISNNVAPMVSACSIKVKQLTPPTHSGFLLLTSTPPAFRFAFGPFASSIDFFYTTATALQIFNEPVTT